MTSLFTSRIQPFFCLQRNLWGHSYPSNRNVLSVICNNGEHLEKGGWRVGSSSSLKIKSLPGDSDSSSLGPRNPYSFCFVLFCLREKKRNNNCFRALKCTRFSKTHPGIYYWFCLTHRETNVKLEMISGFCFSKPALLNLRILGSFFAACCSSTSFFPDCHKRTLSLTHLAYLLCAVLVHCAHTGYRPIMSCLFPH